MKKLTIALLLATSTQCIAQQNELVLSPAYVRYHAYNSTFSKRTGGVYDANGGGYQLGLTYLRNINWLQIGGSVELGKLNTVQDNITDNPARRHTIANPYAIFNVLVNGRLQVRKWNFSGGLCGGYMIASARDSYNFFGSGWYEGEKYSVGGMYKGGQIGVAYQMRAKLSVSANFTARFANRQESGIDTNGNFNAPPFNRLNLYNFVVGVHYKF